MLSVDLDICNSLPIDSFPKPPYSGLTMEADARRRVERWLNSQTSNLQRFSDVVPYAEIAAETGLHADDVLQVVVNADPPLYAPFIHVYKGIPRGSKPFALYGYDQNSCLLDWEYSLVAGLKRYFSDHGYYALREVGTEPDIVHLCTAGTLFQLQENLNLRDLIAHENNPFPNNLWLVEVKGKQAFEFDHYTFAEGLGQIFEFPAEFLQGLLGSAAAKAGGHLYRMAVQLATGYWGKTNRRIHLALAIPNFSPTILWSGGKTVVIASSIYNRPLQAFLEYYRTGRSQARTGKYKYQRLFGQVLEAIDHKYDLRKLCAKNSQITFNVLGCESAPGVSQFQIKDLVTGGPPTLTG